MSVANQWLSHFTIAYSDDEVWRFRKFMAARYARADNSGTFFGMLVLVILAIGLVGLGAFKLGLVEPAAFRPVLFTAYAAFATGAASYWLAIRQHFRAIFRRSARGGRTWDYAFGDSGILYKNDTTETRVAWRGVQSVEDFGWAVMFQSGEQALFIPSRVFPDAAARAEFVVAAAQRIRAAGDSGRAKRD